MTEFNERDVFGSFICHKTPDNPYWARICEIANKQREKGMSQYGQGIECNPADIHTRVNMALEELVDLAMYLCWVEDQLTEKENNNE